jgi:hypothetical protein
MQVWNHFPLKKNLPYCKKTAAEALNIRLLHRNFTFSHEKPCTKFQVVLEMPEIDFTEYKRLAPNI